MKTFDKSKCDSVKQSIDGNTDYVLLNTGLDINRTQTPVLMASRVTNPSKVVTFQVLTLIFKWDSQQTVILLEISH